MDTPLKITFRDMESTEALEREIRKRASDLEKYFHHIIGCRVVVEAPSQHHRNGQNYRVRLEVSVPGGDPLIANRDPGDTDTHEDALLAIRETFDAMERELKKFADKRFRKGRNGMS